MTENERIAKLEAQQGELFRMIQEMRDEQRQGMSDLRGDVAAIKKQVTSWRGIVLGIVLTVSALWTGGIGVWNMIKHKLAG